MVRQFTDLPGPSSALYVVNELCDSIDERPPKQSRDKEKPERKHSHTSASFVGE